MGSLDSELELHRHKNDILAYYIATSHFSYCMHPVDKFGESLLRQLTKWDLIVLNGRTERDSRGESTFFWDEEQWRSVLDLAITPKNMCADIEVSRFRMPLKCNIMLFFSGNTWGGQGRFYNWRFSKLVL